MTATADHDTLLNCHTTAVISACWFTLLRPAAGDDDVFLSPINRTTSSDHCDDEDANQEEVGYNDVAHLVGPPMTADVVTCDVVT